MNALKTLMIGALSAAALSPAYGAEVVPAWQTPGYVMDEIIVTAAPPAKSSVQDVLAAISATLDVYIAEAVANARVPRHLVTKISSGERIFFARGRI